MEIPKWAYIFITIALLWASFQSFFWWKSRNGIMKSLSRPIAQTCFNPSFDGNPEMGRGHSSQNHFSQRVSILLLMEIPKWDLDLRYIHRVKTQFQSFFWWKSRNGLLAPDRLGLRCICFNPSFDGNPEMGMFLWYFPSGLIVFQSFFWWKSRNGAGVGLNLPSL